MATNKLPIVFIVRGYGEFPYDMLRYDACYPAFESETTRFNFDMRRNPEWLNEPREITLISNTRKEPTVGRWESFGWKVVKP